MRVIAKKPGFYGGSRRRIGAEFEMSEKDMKDGKLPIWVVPASPEARVKLADAKRVQEDRDIAAAKAAAGPKRAGRNAVTETEVGDLV